MSKKEFIMNLILLGFSPETTNSHSITTRYTRKSIAIHVSKRDGYDMTSMYDVSRQGLIFNTGNFGDALEFLLEYLADS